MFFDALFKDTYMCLVTYMCHIILWYFYKFIFAKRGGGWTTTHLYVHCTCFMTAYLWDDPLVIRVIVSSERPAVTRGDVRRRDACQTRRQQCLRVCVGDISLRFTDLATIGQFISLPAIF